MNIRKAIKMNNFTRNITLLVSGSAFAQALNFVFSPVLTRLYTPDEYGLVSIFTAVLGSLSFIGSLNYELAIPIADDDDDAVNILLLSLMVLITTVSLINILLIFFKIQILSFLKAEELIKFFYFVPIALFLIGVYNILTQWAYRKKNFTSLTKTKVSQSVAQNIISIIFAVGGKGSIGLLIGKIVGQSAGISTLFSSLFKSEKNSIRSTNFHKIISLSKRYKEFPFFTTPRRYLGDVSISLPILFLTSFFGKEIVGWFGLANSVMQIPMSLIGNAISNVYYAECATLKRSNPKKILSLSNKLLKTLMIIGGVPLLIMLVIGPQLFSFVFGIEWMNSGKFAQLLVFSVFFRFVFKPISNIFDIFEKQRVSFWINVVRLFIVVSVFYGSRIVGLNSYETVGLYSISMGAVYYLQFIVAKRILKQYM